MMPGVFAIDPPIEPMLAKLAAAVPAGAFLYEPKWDGFRAIVFRGADEVFIQSRDLRPLDRYFPDMHAAFLTALPEGSVIDGELVIATPQGPRLRCAADAAASSGVARGPARRRDAGRVRRLRRAGGGRRGRAAAAAGRTSPAAGASCWPGVRPPMHLTPITRDRAQAEEWLARFEGAGLDGVIAKPESGRLSARGARDDQGEALADGGLRGGGVPVAQGRQGRARRLAAAGALRRRAAPASRRRHLVVHDGGAAAAGRGAGAAASRARSSVTRGANGRRRARAARACPADRADGAPGKDLSWEPLRIERVCEVKYDHMQGDRFRHAAVFARWRPDKPPRRLRLRPARGHSGVRAREGLRRVGPGSLTPLQSSARFSSGSSGSCPGRSASGTCCRLTRTRVQVR